MKKMKSRKNLQTILAKYRGQYKVLILNTIITSSLLGGNETDKTIQINPYNENII